MSVIEYGKCEVCGKEGVLFRTYFHYGFKCQCHSPNHFEFVRHCQDCVPQKPTETKVVLSNEQAESLKPVQRGEREINADELLKRLDQYFEDNGLEHKWTGDDIADSMSDTVEDIVRIVKEMLGESDDEDEETGWW